MKKIIILLLLIGLLAGCKDKEIGLPDLSKGSLFLGQYQGDWFLYFQQIDSIDEQGKPWYKHWPTEYGGKHFRLVTLNSDHTLYEKITDFEYDLNNYNYKDFAAIDPETKILTMAVYDNVGINAVRPDSMGQFIGKYDKNTNSVYGYFKLRAYWYCPYCPMGMRDRYANVVVQANIH